MKGLVIEIVKRKQRRQNRGNTTKGTFYSDLRTFTVDVMALTPLCAICVCKHGETGNFYDQLCVQIIGPKFHTE